MTLRRFAFSALGVLALAVAALLPATISYRTTAIAPLVLAGAVAFVVLALEAPGWALPLACLLAPLEGIEVPVGALGGVTPTESAFLVLAGGWAWRALARPGRVAYPTVADWPAVAFILLLLLGATIGAPIAVVGKLAVMWGAFFIATLVLRELAPHEVRRTLYALGIGAGLLGITGVANFVSGGGAVVAQSGASVAGRASSGIDDPNYYAAYLVLGAVPLFAMAVLGRVRMLPVAAAAGAAAFGGIVLSLSRGATLALALAVGIVLIARSRTRWVSIAIGGALTVATLFGTVPMLRGDVTEVVSERLSSIAVQSSNNKRLLLWTEAADVVLREPLTGVGALQFEHVANRRGLTQEGVPLANVHNAPLNIAVELGLPALLAYLLWWVRIGRDLVREGRRRRPETFPIVLGVGAALAGFALQGLTVSHYQVQIVQATFFVLAGAAAAIGRWPDDIGQRLDGVGNRPDTAAAH